MVNISNDLILNFGFSVTSECNGAYLLLYGHASMSKSKYWFTLNQNNMSECRCMFSIGLLF